MKTKILSQSTNIMPTASSKWILLNAFIIPLTTSSQRNLLSTLDPQTARPHETHMETTKTTVVFGAQDWMHLIGGPTLEPM